jgi:hypothetical protein
MRDGVSIATLLLAFTACGGGAARIDAGTASSDGGSSGCVDRIADRYRAVASGAPSPVPEEELLSLEQARALPGADWSVAGEAARLAREAGFQLEVAARAAGGWRFASPQGAVEMQTFSIAPGSRAGVRYLGGVSVIRWVDDGRVDVLAELVTIPTDPADTRLDVVASVDGATTSCSATWSDTTAAGRVRDLGPLSDCELCDAAFDVIKGFGCAAASTVICGLPAIVSLGLGAIPCGIVVGLACDAVVNSGLDAVGIGSEAVCTPVLRALGSLDAEDACPASPSCQWPETPCETCQAACQCPASFQTDAIGVLLCHTLPEGASELCEVVASQLAGVIWNETSVGCDAQCAPWCEPTCGDHKCGDGEDATCPGDCREWTCSTSDGAGFCIGDSVCSSYESCGFSPECACTEDERCFVAGTRAACRPVATGGVCRAIKLEGEPCQIPRECGIFTCLDGVCDAYNLVGRPCETDLQCHRGGQLYQSCVFGRCESFHGDGEDCDSDHDCTSWSCWAGFCQDQLNVCDEGCDSDYDCVVQYFDPVLGWYRYCGNCIDDTCVTPAGLTLGDPCEHNQHCLGYDDTQEPPEAWICLHGACALYGGLGSSCDSDDDCREPDIRCVDGACVVAPSPGDRCDSDADCGGGYCDCGGLPCVAN